MRWPPEIDECIPEGHCDDCQREAEQRAKSFGTLADDEYKNVFYMNHVWDGM